MSIVLISTKEYKRLDEINKLFKISFEKNEIPSAKEVFKSKISSFTDKIVSVPIPCKENRVIYQDLYSQLNNFTKEEIIGKLLTLNFENDKISKKLTSGKKDQPKKSMKLSDNNIMSKLVINIGRSSKLTPEMLIKLINKTIRSRDTEIGKINISKNYATFEIESKMKDVVISKMQHIRYYRKRISVSSYNQDIIESLPNKKNKNKKRRRN